MDSTLLLLRLKLWLLGMRLEMTKARSLRLMVGHGGGCRLLAALGPSPLGVVRR
jgi:hypothetical protein